MATAKKATKTAKQVEETKVEDAPEVADAPKVEEKKVEKKVEKFFPVASKMASDGHAPISIIRRYFAITKGYENAKLQEAAKKFYKKNIEEIKEKGVLSVFADK